MDGHRGGDHQGTASQNPAYRPAHRHQPGQSVAPAPRDTWVTRDWPCSGWTASRNRSSSAGQTCEYVSSVSLAFLWPSADCTALIEHPAPASSEAAAKELAAGDLPALDALRSVQVPGGVSVSVWLKAADTPEGTFYDRRARLMNRGLVTNLGTDRAPRYFVPEDEEEI